MVMSVEESIQFLESMVTRWCEENWGAKLLHYYDRTELKEGWGGKSSDTFTDPEGKKAFLKVDIGTSWPVKYYQVSLTIDRAYRSILFDTEELQCPALESRVARTFELVLKEYLGGSVDYDKFGPNAVIVTPLK